MTSSRSCTVARLLAAGLIAFLLPIVVACSGETADPPSADSAAAAIDAAAPATDADPAAEAPADAPPEIPTLPRGLVAHEPGVSDGYLLFGPLLSDTTYLMDNDGMIVHTWHSPYAPSGTAYLLPNGNLLRGAREPGVEVFKGGGQGGRLQEFTWDGEKVWDFEFATADHLLHHDIEVLPNGNILAIAWQAKSADQARAAGRNPAATPENGLWPDMVIEIEPQRPSGGRIVWEWHAWDHLVQNADPALPNYGDPAEHPSRIDINAGAPPDIDPAQLEQLKALGYVPPDTQPEDIGSDLFHTNAIAYNAELDQIALSTPRLNEIWIIDHSTTTEEAAGNSGGRWGKGGDLLYRWGNPAAYGRGDADDQTLFAQHDVRWIPPGLPGAGHLMIFNNDVPSPDGNYSEVVEIAPPMDAGGYTLAGGQPWGSADPAWRYGSSGEAGFYSPFISGATRLPNGNTLICSGAQGRFLEVTPDGSVVWDYRDDHSGDVRMPDGSRPHPVGEFTYAVFRVTRIAPNHPALAGRTLAPLDPQPPVAGEGRD
jgi:hypothetical protein